MTRAYRKSKRAELEKETRQKIVRATMALHVKQGVATTSLSDVAAWAGVGAATVSRHFPTVGSLVEACGAEFWHQISPPQSDQAAAIFAGHRSRSARWKRLVEELDAFYSRACGPLWSAVRDQDRVPELAAFLEEVAASIVALVAEALGEGIETKTVKITAAVLDFTVWRALSGSGTGQEETASLMYVLVDAAIKSTGKEAA